MLSQILPATNLLLIVVISAVVIHNFKYLSVHRCHKNRLINEVSDLYPLVEPDFLNQPLVQQTAENNHEIHEINNRLDAIEKRLNAIEKRLKELENG